MSEDIKKYRSIIEEGYQASSESADPTSTASESVKATAAKILESIADKKVSSEALFESLINNLPNSQDALNRKFAVAVLNEMKTQRKTRL